MRTTFMFREAVAKLLNPAVDFSLAGRFLSNTLDQAENRSEKERDLESQRQGRRGVRRVKKRMFSDDIRETIDGPGTKTF